METHRDRTAGYRTARHTGGHRAAAAGPHVEVGRLLAHLDRRVVAAYLLTKGVRAPHPVAG